jgi:hypothetical protein
VRQLAAVEARKRVDKHWPLCAGEIKSNVRTTLVQHVVTETDPRVSHALARIIASIALEDFPNNAWPELVPMMMQASESPAVAHREVAIYVMLALAEVLVEDETEGHIPKLLELFGRTMQDPESSLVRQTSLEAIGVVSDYVDSSNSRVVKCIQDLVPQMVTVLNEAITEGNEQGASKGFNVFDSMLSSEAPLFKTHFAAFVEFCVAAFTNTQVSDSIRVMAGNLIVLLPLYRRSSLTKLKLTEPILSHCLVVAVEPETVDDEDDEEDSPARSALRIVNSFATHLPPQHVFPLVSAKIVELAGDTSNPSARRASMMCIALIVEGCADAMRPHVENLVHLVLKLMVDPIPFVRRGACLALASLAEAIEIEVTAMHSQILPVLFQLMQDTSNIDVLRNATNALDAVLECLGDEILPYIHGLMEALLQLLTVPDTRVRQVVTAAIGSAAHAAGEGFIQYFPHVFPKIFELMNIKSEDADEMLIRGIATDSMSAIAEAVGADVFRQYLHQVANVVAVSMNMDSPKLKECAFCFFGVLSRSFKSEFTPFLPTLIPILFESIRAQESFMDDPEEQDLSTSTGLSGEDNHESMDSDSNDDDSEFFKANSALAEEKATAIDVLGDLFEHTETEFLPFLDETMALLNDRVTHYNESVRKSIVLTFFKILATLHKMSLPAPWVAGVPLQVQLHENVVNVIQVVMTSIVKMLDEEDDRGVASDICESLASALRLIGPGMVEKSNILQGLAKSIHDILNGKHLAQQDADEESLEPEELAELDGVLVSSAGDVVGALASVLGPNSFESLGQMFLPQISKYYKPQSQTAERSMAVGTLAEVAQGMREGVTMWHAPLVQLFTRALSDPEIEVRSNAAYGIGVLCEYTGTSYDATTFLNLLQPIIADSTNSVNLPQACDNACGAIARILLRADSWKSLPNFMGLLAQGLPLRSDYEENKPVFALIGRVLRLAIAGDADALRVVCEPCLSSLVQAIAHVLVPENHNQITVELRGELTQLFRDLASSPLCTALRNAVSKLNEELQSAVQAAMAA